ncbi:hypothetical protein PpBr36_07837 [Pyricularia pennisetigena]|uniref:hypothetical protein n=1 Tax=Pyricularia pennisetigena TaxID=1578925 RepID=UPI001151B214|nr:hypothetical protein PpBr36_07837 [Pyricularia pennisetigena]TLS25760.1 hypothetical protein PpBr36_07837 [Pyricularia pennisetigena]
MVTKKKFDIDAIDFDLTMVEEKSDIIRLTVASASSLEHCDSNHLLPLLRRATQVTKRFSIFFWKARCASLMLMGQCQWSTIVERLRTLVPGQEGKCACRQTTDAVRTKVGLPNATKELATTAGSRADVHLLPAVDHAWTPSLSSQSRTKMKKWPNPCWQSAPARIYLKIMQKQHCTLLARGDQPVVRQLLLPKNSPADPNAPGPGLCKPLMGELQNRPSIAVKVPLTRML